MDVSVVHLATKPDLVNRIAVVKSVDKVTGRIGICCHGATECLSVKPSALSVKVSFEGLCGNIGGLRLN